MQPAWSRLAWAECSRGRLRHNLGLLAPAGGAAKLLAVVKADAYGHGAVPAARALQAAGVRAFGVATLEEGLELRRAGLRGQVLVLGGVEPSYLRDAAEAGIGISAWSRGYLDEAQRRLRGRGRLDLHLKVDTGMSRLGFGPPEVPGLLGDFSSGRWPRLRLASAYTHFACADERRDSTSPRQLKAFASLPWPPGLRLHAANSAAALRYPAARLGWVRSGILLYGALDPSLAPAAHRQRPLLKFYAAVVRVAALAKGQGVSYGHAFRAPRAMRVATVCAGYADGVPRALSQRGSVRIAGKDCRILGRVCMDLLMADVSRLPGLRPGARVSLLEDLEGPCSARGWAALAGTNAYEILCGISPRVPRRWEA